MKGYYKRAKAHAAVWNEKEARRDFNMVATLDVTLASLIGRELKALSERMKEKYWEEKEAYWNMLETKEGKSDTVEKQEDGESAAQKSEDQGEGETRTKCSEGREEELLPGATGNEEEPRPCEINPNPCNLTEGKDWQQMLQLVMLLQNEGNVLIKDKRFQDASKKFKEALEYVDALQNMVSVIDHAGMLRGGNNKAGKRAGLGRLRQKSGSRFFYVMLKSRLVNRIFL